MRFLRIFAFLTVLALSACGDRPAGGEPSAGVGAGRPLIVASNYPL